MVNRFGGGKMLLLVVGFLAVVIATTVVWEYGRFKDQQEGIFYEGFFLVQYFPLPRAGKLMFLWPIAVLFLILVALFIGVIILYLAARGQLEGQATAHFMPAGA